MINKGQIEGYLVSVEPYGKTATVIIETEETDYHTKIKFMGQHTFKVFGEALRDNVVQMFEDYGRTLVIIEYRKQAEETKTSKAGFPYTTKELKITRIQCAGGEVQQEEPLKVIQREPEVIEDDSDDLPF